MLGVEVKRHTFQNSAVDGCERSTLRPRQVKSRGKISLKLVTRRKIRAEYRSPAAQTVTGHFRNTDVQLINRGEGL